jgi:hypothetical protein
MGAGGERADRNNSLPRRVSGAPSSIDGFIWAGNQRTSGIKGVFASRG